METKTTTQENGFEFKENYDCEQLEFLTIESMLNSNEYNDFINDKPIEKIITCVKLKKGANLEEIKTYLNYPIRFVNYILDTTIRYWNTYFDYGRIILNESDNKYYHIKKTDPRVGHRKIKMVIYD